MEQEKENLNSPKKSMYIALVVGAVFLAVIMYQQATNFSSKTFVVNLEKAREQKDLRFRNDPNSPIPKGDREAFEGLMYFPAKEKFRVKAELIATPNPDTVNLLTTTGKPRKMLDAGVITFSIEEKAYKLTAFEYLDEAEPTLFVPFTDETTGHFTYGGGRYLDIPKKENLFIDFNEAYNPYCVYNEDFSCPIPPRENHLGLAIKVGERNYEPEKRKVRP
ncbi:MAG: DUF1684 domain-containing protein [Bacteroidota bacterium]